MLHDARVQSAVVAMVMQTVQGTSVDCSRSVHAV